MSRTRPYPYDSYSDKSSSNNNNYETEEPGSLDVPTPKRAIELARRVQLAQQNELDALINLDVQRLKATAVQLIKETLPDKTGFYAFRVHQNIKGEGIEYKKPQVVVDRFCQYMEELGYALPKVEYKSGFGFLSGNSGTYTFRFRIR